MSQQRDRVAFVSHCILNQATRARWAGGGARREAGMLRDVVEVLLSQGVGVVQLECPEFSLYGNPRPLRSKDGYDTPVFRDHCRGIAVRACDLIERYVDGGGRSNVVAIVGVENSPSCGVNSVTRTVEGENVAMPGRGHLMDELEAEMHIRGIEIPLIGVSLRPKEQRKGLMRLRKAL